MKVGKADNIVKNTEYTKYYFLNLYKPKYETSLKAISWKFQLNKLIEADIVLFGMS